MALLLLDTCAVIWLANDQSVSDDVRHAIRCATDAGDPIFVSPITAWEIGLLVVRGRLSLQMSPARWFDRVMQAPGMTLAIMSPAVLLGSSFLPGVPPRDPADRILAATARESGHVLVTRDRPLLEYSRAGHLQAMPC